MTVKKKEALVAASKKAGSANLSPTAQRAKALGSKKTVEPKPAPLSVVAKKLVDKLEQLSPEGTAAGKTIATVLSGKAFVMPNTPAKIADLYYAMREQRYKLQRQAEALSKCESQMRDHLIDVLPKSDASGVTGVIANATIETVVVPKVTDWTALHAYVKRTGAFELLQRRLSDGAVKERWDAKKSIPGIGKENVKKVSLTKKGK